jgi:hypothetical protein
MIIKNYKVTSNHATGKYPASARVKTLDNVLLAEVVAPRGDVLLFLRQRPQSYERLEFVRQLVRANVPLTDIELILAMPKGKKEIVGHRIKDRK